MNKNITIAILVLLVIILGYVAMKGKSGLQEAATVKSQDAVSLQKEIEANKLLMVSKGGSITSLSGASQSKISQAIQTVVPSTVSTGSVNRPYTCYLTGSGDAVVFQFESQADHGIAWHPLANVVCFAN